MANEVTQGFAQNKPVITGVLTLTTTRVEPRDWGLVREWHAVKRQLAIMFEDRFPTA